MQPTDKIMRQMIVEWLALAENDALDGARLSPLFFNLTDEGNHKRALNMIKWVIEDVMNWTPHEALNFIGKDFIDKMGLKTCYEKVIFPEFISKRSNYRYIVQLCYPDQIAEYDKKRLWIMEYNNALSVEKTLTKGSFTEHDARDKARYMLNHYLKNHVGAYSTSKEKAYEFFASSDGEKLIKTAKLGVAQNLLFDSALEFFHESVGCKDDFYYGYAQFLAMKNKQSNGKDKTKCKK